MQKQFQRTRTRSRQRGVSLLFALLTLGVLLLGTLALVRAVDTGALILGNIGFKNDATAAGDQATRQAIAWLVDNASALSSDAPASGYYSTNRQYNTDGTTLRGPLDVTGRQFPGSTNRQLIDWDGDGCVAAGTGDCALKSASAGTINGNTARYAIFRQCAKTGDYSADSTIVCTRPVVSSSSGPSKKGELNYAEATRLTAAEAPYYNIVVRIQGARNTVSYTETLVHF